MAKEKKNYWLKHVPIAHRGLHDSLDAPENTVAAFRNAIRDGYGIEIDVQLLKDGTFAVFHDKKLNRLTGGHGLLRRRTFKEICMLTIGQSSQRIPSLEDVLSFVEDYVPLVIELKGSFLHLERDAKALADVLASYKGRYVLVSSDPRAVLFWSRYSREITTGQIFHDRSFLGLWACVIVWILFGRQGRCLLVPVGCVSRRFFQRFKTQKQLLLAWTVHSYDALILAEKYADNIIFEEIGDFRYGQDAA